MGLPSSPRNGARVIWVTLHTAEGSRRAIDLYNFFNNNQNASSHVGIDGSGFYDWVGRDRAAWTLLNGNPISVNAELCGFARWTRDQWLSTGTVDGVVNPRAMVRNAALWAKRECEVLGVPKQYIGVQGAHDRRAGIIIHWDYSRGTGDGDHWDTGENFPLDVFFADMGGATEGDDMTPEQDGILRDIQKALGAAHTLTGKNIGTLSAETWHRSVDTNDALAAVWELTGKNIGQALAELVADKGDPMTDGQAAAIADKLAASAPEAFLNALRDRLAS